MNISPLLGDNFMSDPYIFDFSSDGDLAGRLDTNDFDSFQREVLEHIESSGKDYGIGKYLEERKTLLRNYPQIVEEGRYYHLGLDIIVPGDTDLFAPISGRVYKTGVETGMGNYGGHIIFEHNISGHVFFTFYGHLDEEYFPKIGDMVLKGGKFGVTGSKKEQTGGWFTHTHLQIITAKAMDEGRAMQGYISANELPLVEELFPSPYLLFRS